MRRPRLPRTQSPLFTLLLLTLLLVLALGLSSTATAAEPEPQLIVCSTTQVADFTRQVVGDRFRVACVLAPGQDPHLYKVKPSDAKLVSGAVLCIQMAGDLEGHDWMAQLAATANKPLITCVNGVKPLQLEDDDRKIRDPHAWFSPRNAAQYVRNIEMGVSKIDPDHKYEYEARSALYRNQLRTLDLWIQRQVKDVKHRKLITSHDAFNYFCAAYGFEAGAPVGWSTGQEAGGGVTPARRKKTVDSIRKFGVPTIFVETSVNKKLIVQIAKEAGVTIGGELYSDSMGRAGTAEKRTWV